MYGTIRMHQEKKYPNRVVGTTLVNPDFAAFARAFGAHGETVRHTEEFRPAFERALAANKPAVIELKIDAEALTPRQSLSQIRASRRPVRGYCSVQRLMIPSSLIPDLESERWHDVGLARRAFGSVRKAVSDEAHRWTSLPS